MKEIVKSWVSPWWGLGSVNNNLSKKSGFILWAIPPIIIIIAMLLVYVFVMKSASVTMDRAGFYGFLIVMIMLLSIIISMVANLITGALAFNLWKRMYSEIPLEMGYIQVLAGQAKINVLMLLQVILMFVAFGHIAPFIWLVFFLWFLGVVYSIVKNLRLTGSRKWVAMVMYVVIYILVNVILNSIMGSATIYK